MPVVGVSNFSYHSYYDIDYAEGSNDWKEYIELVATVISQSPSESNQSHQRHYWWFWSGMKEQINEVEKVMICPTIEINKKSKRLPAKTTDLCDCSCKHQYLWPLELFLIFVLVNVGIY